jgi:hypothetical protein
VCTRKFRGIEIATGLGEGCHREVGIQQSSTIHLAHTYYMSDLGPLYTSDQGPGQIILLVTALGQEP